MYTSRSSILDWQWHSNSVRILGATDNKKSNCFNSFNHNLTCNSKDTGDRYGHTLINRFQVSVYHQQRNSRLQVDNLCIKLGFVYLCNWVLCFKELRQFSQSVFTTKAALSVSSWLDLEIRVCITPRGRERRFLDPTGTTTKLAGHYNEPTKTAEDPANSENREVNTTHINIRLNRLGEVGSFHNLIKHIRRDNSTSLRYMCGGDQKTRKVAQW